MSAENVAVSAFLQYGRRDRRSSENALEILKIVCAQRTAMIGSLGKSPSRSRSPSPDDSCKRTNYDEETTTARQQTARRGSFSPVLEVDGDIDKTAEKPKEKRKSLTSLVAVVQASKEFSKLNQGKACAVSTDLLHRKSSLSRKGTELSLDMDVVPRMGHRQSVGMIDLDLNNPYPPVSKRAERSLDKAESPRGNSVALCKDKLLSGRSSLSNNLTNSPGNIEPTVLLDDVTRISSVSGRRLSNSTSYTQSSSASKYYSADSGTKSCKPYPGVPGNCQVRADSKAPGARLKRHLENMYSQMTTAERLLVEAERRKLNQGPDSVMNSQLTDKTASSEKRTDK